MRNIKNTLNKVSRELKIKQGQEDYDKDFQQWFNSS